MSTVTIEKEGQTNRASSNQFVYWPVINKTTCVYLFPSAEGTDEQVDPFKHAKHIPANADVRKLLEARWPGKRRFCRPTKRDIEQMNDLGLLVLSVFATGSDHSISSLARLLCIPEPDYFRAILAAAEIYGLTGPALRAIGEAAEKPEDVPRLILDHIAERKAVLA